MLLDIRAFVTSRQAAWAELEQLLQRLDRDPAARFTLTELRRFHYLYQGAAADLVRLRGVEPKSCAYLETLVGRAYSEIHEARRPVNRFAPRTWFTATLPQTFRRRWRAALLAAAICLAGALTGALLLLVDYSLKSDLLPFPHLQGSPAERVATEERLREEPDRPHATFASYLMTHNTQIAVLVLACGMTCGIGTVIILFQNGLLLGAVAADYLMAGEGLFLAGWLLPHGVIEIPAILIGAQAGLVLAGALVGNRGGQRHSLRLRLYRVRDDLVTLIAGTALLLIWAGFVEAFFSQYHEPVIPYVLKIGFGLLELGALMWYLLYTGRHLPPSETDGV